MRGVTCATDHTSCGLVHRSAASAALCRCLCPGKLCLVFCSSPRQPRTHPDSNANGRARSALSARRAELPIPVSAMRANGQVNTFGAYCVKALSLLAAPVGWVCFCLDTSPRCWYLSHCAHPGPCACACVCLHTCRRFICLWSAAASLPSGPHCALLAVPVPPCLRQQPWRCFGTCKAFRLVRLRRRTG